MVARSTAYLMALLLCVSRAEGGGSRSSGFMLRPQPGSVWTCKQGSLRGGGEADSARNTEQTVQRKIDQVELEIKRVDEDLRKVDKQVESTEKELKDVEKQKAQARLQLLEEGINHEYWQKIERDMEEKEKYLRKENEHLRKEKEHFRKEKEHLRKEKEDLREYIALLKKDKDDLNLSWTETALDLGYAGHKEGGKLFCLDLSFPGGISSGQARQSVLYCRESFNEQWRFLEENVCNKGSVGWIIGPPGTGKTLTTMSFIQSLGIETGWRVMCVRVWRSGGVSLLQVIDGKQRVCQKNMVEAARSLSKTLEEWTGSNRKHLVALDGFVQGVQVAEELYSICLEWRDRDRENRRLVIATSTSSRGKTYPEQDKLLQAEELKVYSWTLGEYMEAVKYDLLYDGVAKAIGAGSTMGDEARERRERLVESKYQIVGGSCRYMFEYTTEEAIKALRAALDAVGDFSTLMNFRFGTLASQYVNRLHGLYRNGKQDSWTLISRFVATELAQKLGESLVKILQELPYMTENPIVAGFLFEMLFFARIARQGVQGTAKSGQAVEWERCAVKTFDPKRMYPREDYTLREEKKARICLKPLAWNQGGYDAVIVDWKARSVCFVQVTKGTTHDLDLRYLSDCLETLSLEGEQWTVKIAFVVAKDKLEAFRVGDIANEGALSKYGWRRGEEKSKVCVFGIDPKAQG